MPPPTDPYQPYAAQHAEIKGPGDERPTALQVVNDCNALNKFRGRVAVCTGCSSGIGVETARALYEAGFTLFLTARDNKKLEDVIEDIVTKSTTFKDSGDKPPRPVGINMHLDSFKSVREGAKEILKQTDVVNLLVNNAGVMASPYATTQDGLEMQLGTNHYAHFLLFQELKDALLKGATSETPSRVINVSSDGHLMTGILFDDIGFSGGNNYDKWKAYGQSKTANIYMASSIHRHFASQGLIGLSLHPGVIETPLARHMNQDDYAMLEGMGVYKIAKNVEQGAATTVWAAIAPYFDKPENGGRYLADVGESPKYAPHAYDEEAEEKFWKLSEDVISTNA